MGKTEIRICGLGGQGVVLMGQILGKAAAYEGKNVVQTQSYGAEARGSAAKSEIIISDGKIGFPFVRKCDILIAMSQEALEKNIESLKENGILIFDNSAIKDAPKIKAKVYAIPATSIAEKSFGQKIYANMIMLSALTKITNLVKRETVKKVIKEVVDKKTLDKNLRAYDEGEKLVNENL
ncbi:MAG: 2-oxoacid:acceptor oxidoreductase family protein [Candidatus Bathyarchaeales archaeon]